MEARGQTQGTVLGTLHYGSRWPANASTSGNYVLPRGGCIADFHLYALKWEPGRIRWFVDGIAYQTQDFWWSRRRLNERQGVPPTSEAELNTWPAPLDERFHLLIKLSVGGAFLGNPDATTRFPAELEVDFARVCERRGSTGQTFPRGPGVVPFVTP